MHIYQYVLLVLHISLALGIFSLHRQGWLDKVVAYHKNKLFEDLRQLPTVKIIATVQRVPPGYVDSPAWDFASVVRLLALIRHSDAALPARRFLGKLFRTRRMSYRDTFKHFPSLSKTDDIYAYYDIDSAEAYGDEVMEYDPYPDDGIIVISNPVEARLPSAMISVDLMREILESRAIAARYMPTTEKVIPWTPMTTGAQTSMSTTDSVNDTNATTASEDTSSNMTQSEDGSTPGTNNSTVTDTDNSIAPEGEQESKRKRYR